MPRFHLADFWWCRRGPVGPVRDDSVYLCSFNPWIPSMYGDSSAYDDIYQLAGDYDHFHNPLAVKRRLYLRFGQSALADNILWRVCRHDNAAAQLAVDLHRDFDLVFFRQRGIVLRPGGAQQASLFTQPFPAFVGE